jgi:hypothetical protein
MKGELSLDKGQFNGQHAEPRVALWVELVATVLWLLFALRKFAQSDAVPWPKGWRGRRLTPGAVRRMALDFSSSWASSPHSPKCEESRPGGQSGLAWSCASGIGSSVSAGDALRPRADRAWLALSVG